VPKRLRAYKIPEVLKPEVDRKFREPAHQAAFERLKSDLCNAVTLHTVNFSKNFGLLVDASATAVSCCLIQWTADGVERLLAFASLKLSNVQSRWATTEREAYAVIWAL
jgi:hypothetical protein